MEQQEGPDEPHRQLFRGSRRRLLLLVECHRAVAGMRIAASHAARAAAGKDGRNVRGIVKVGIVCSACKVQRVVHGRHLPKQRRGWFCPTQYSPCFCNPQRVRNRRLAEGLLRKAGCHVQAQCGRQVLRMLRRKHRSGKRMWLCRQCHRLVHIRDHVCTGQAPVAPAEAVIVHAAAHGAAPLLDRVYASACCVSSPGCRSVGLREQAQQR
mmetsp:Transcript_6425/g.18954  ORF Transcript_6425/g.18954 Transcript_6425/m.18954 type:complete len:210 (-) Transcript_6425:20-649(-)